METFTPGTLEALNGTDVRLKCTFRSPVPAGPKLTVSWYFQSELKEPLEAVSPLACEPQGQRDLPVPCEEPTRCGRYHWRDPPECCIEKKLLGGAYFGPHHWHFLCCNGPPCGGRGDLASLAEDAARQDKGGGQVRAIEAEGRRRGKGGHSVGRGGPSVLIHPWALWPAGAGVAKGLLLLALKEKTSCT